MDDKSNLKDDLVAEIKQEPESLDMTPLTSFKSIMRQALGYDDLTPIDLTKHISVALRSSTGSNAIAEREADSDILRFFASGEYPATSLKVSIVPVQEGTGYPSPENIRPITGWTAVKIYQAAEYDEAAEPVLEIALGDDAGTVYGGTLDIITGVLTVDRAYQEFDGSEAWGYWTGATNTFSLSGLSVYAAVAKVTSGISSHFTVNGSFNPAPSAGNNLFCRRDNRVSVCRPEIEEEVLTDVDEFKSYLAAQKTAGTPFSIVFYLSTPRTYELDPEELSTLIGENNIWADCGPVESITY